MCSGASCFSTKRSPPQRRRTGGYAQSSADQVKYAIIIVSTLPILCLYPFVQKYFEKGVMIGAVKS
jgi:ABC-type glycerol-3-phosphate transport system permease component